MTHSAIASCSTSLVVPPLIYKSFIFVDVQFSSIFITSSTSFFTLLLCFLGAPIYNLPDVSCAIQNLHLPKFRESRIQRLAICPLSSWRLMVSPEIHICCYKVMQQNIFSLSLYHLTWNLLRVKLVDMGYRPKSAAVN